MEDRLPSFLASACLHLALASIVLLLPQADPPPLPAGGMSVSGYVTLGRPGAARSEAKKETAATGSGQTAPGKAPPPPPEPQAPPPPPPEPQAPPAPPDPQAPPPPSPPEAVKSAPDTPLRDPLVTPVPKNPEKTEVNTPEPKKEPPKADPPKKNEAPKKPPLKTPDPPKKPPAAPKPQKDSLAAALAELSREAGRSAPRGNRAPSGQTRAGGRDQAEAGGQANGDASGPSPGGDGGDGYGALGAYQDSIISRVRPNWSLPARADRRSYTAVVNIKIDRDGAILEARIIRSSGNGFFDASVMQAVAATKNLEPPPLPDYSDINISFTPESLGRQ